MKIHRGYSPTQEYMEMFPWKDGYARFDWDKAKSEGKLDEMFLKGTGTASDGLINIKLTPVDPAVMYGRNHLRTVRQESLDWTTGNMSGYCFEIVVGEKFRQWSYQSNRFICYGICTYQILNGKRYAA